jgi:hypothetical protein
MRVVRERISKKRRAAVGFFSILFLSDQEIPEERN